MTILFVKKTKSVGVETPIFEMEMSGKTNGRNSHHGIDIDTCTLKCPITKLREMYHRLKEETSSSRKKGYFVKNENIPLRIIKGFL